MKKNSYPLPLRFGWILLLWLVVCPVRATETTRVLIFGDSLSAGYGLGSAPSWVDLLQQRWQQQQRGIKLYNASVSGETSSGGLTRFPAVLDRVQPNIVLFELGANDGLQGMPLQQMHDNLQQMIMLAKANGTIPIITEMLVPPSYGPIYSKKFTQTFHDLAEQEDISLLPFFLTEVYQQQLLQTDGLHPNATAQPLIADKIGDVLLPIIETQQRAGKN